jgi:hypothetical protein
MTNTHPEVTPGSELSDFVLPGHALTQGNALLGIQGYHPKHLQIELDTLATPSHPEEISSLSFYYSMTFR